MRSFLDRARQGGLGSSDDAGEVTVGVGPIDAASYRLGILFERVSERLTDVFLRLVGEGRWSRCGNRGSKRAGVRPRRTGGGSEGAWGVAPGSESAGERELRKRWDGNRDSFFVLRLLCLPATEKGDFALR